ncbi:hypothetical protein D3C83_185340 [compost metagenome]
MYASAIFFPSSSVEATGFWAILQFNPLIHAIEAARDVLLWNQPIPWSRLPLLYAVGLGTAVIGFGCFVRLKRAFADVL